MEGANVKDNIYKITEYYLYNYKNIDNIIKDINDRIIDNVNVSSSAWLKSKQMEGNTLENQAIRLADNKKIYNLKKAKVVINHCMKVFKERNPKRYMFIKMKYFDKATPIDILKKLKYDKKQQTDITETVVSFFYRQLKKAGIGGI